MKTMIALCSLLTSTLAFAGNAAEGKKIFSSHSCTTCHAVGSEGTAQTGPNLAGVTMRRDKTWLRKWLKNPDAMRNDPAIKKMDSKYHSTMPNLGLTDSDVDGLIAYLGSAEQKSTTK